MSCLCDHIRPSGTPNGSPEGYPTLKTTRRAPRPGVHKQHHRRGHILTQELNPERTTSIGAPLSGARSSSFQSRRRQEGGGLVGPGWHTPSTTWAIHHEDGGGGGGGDQLHRDEAAGRAGVDRLQQGADSRPLVTIFTVEPAAARGRARLLTCHTACRVSTEKGGAGSWVNSPLATSWPRVD